MYDFPLAALPLAPISDAGESDVTDDAWSTLEYGCDQADDCEEAREESDESVWIWYLEDDGGAGFD